RVLRALEQHDDRRRLGEDLQLARKAERAERLGRFVGDDEVVVVLLTPSHRLDAVHRFIHDPRRAERGPDPRARALASGNDEGIHEDQSYRGSNVCGSAPASLTPTSQQTIEKPGSGPSRPEGGSMERTMNRKLLAEFVGAFTLIFIGAGAIIQTQ